MEEIASVAIYFRGAERLIIVICGLVCIVLGYLLFKHNITHEQSAEWKSTPFSLKLSKVSPGTFFAVLGAGILCWSIFTVTEITKGEKEYGANMPPAKIPDVNRNTSIISEDTYTIRLNGIAQQHKLLKVYNTIIDVYDPDLLSSLTGSEKSAFNSARLVLVKERLEILKKQYNSKHLNRYFTYAKSTDPIPDDFTKIYNEISLLMTTSFLDD